MAKTPILPLQRGMGHSLVPQLEMFHMQEPKRKGRLILLSRSEGQNQQAKDSMGFMGSVSDEGRDGLWKGWALKRLMGWRCLHRERRTETPASGFLFLS